MHSIRLVWNNESRGGEGELDHQQLRDVVFAIASSRSLEQKLRNAKLLQYQMFNTLPFSPLPNLSGLCSPLTTLFYNVS